MGKKKTACHVVGNKNANTSEEEKSMSSCYKEESEDVGDTCHIKSFHCHTTLS